MLTRYTASSKTEGCVKQKMEGNQAQPESSTKFSARSAQFFRRRRSDRSDLISSVALHLPSKRRLGKSESQRKEKVEEGRLLVLVSSSKTTKIKNRGHQQIDV